MVDLYVFLDGLLFKKLFFSIFRNNWLYRHCRWKSWSKN